MDFKIEGRIKGGLGRAGVINTPHGRIETPAFVLVGTKATVKALEPRQLEELGAEVILGNTYHLYLEPGEDVVLKAGGLGKFMNWPGPTMTDSGGFQVFSLGADFGRKVGKIRDPRFYSDVLENIRIKNVAGEGEVRAPMAKIDEDGVTFKSAIDGSSHRFTPEKSIEIQHSIGADIIFALDECTSPEAPYEYQVEALARTHRWATRSLIKHRDLEVESGKLKFEAENIQSAPHLEAKPPSGGQALFGIVQGGRFEDLRKESAKTIGALEFDGFGIGGSFDKDDVAKTVGSVNAILPPEKPRHLLGIGRPEDLFIAVEEGCDLFDCVAPTRLARNGGLYTMVGKINIFNAKFSRDFNPVDAVCRCYTCANFSCAYLAHLFRSREILGYTLASIHNVSFIVNLVKDMRRSILDGTFFELKETFLKRFQND